MPPIKIFLKTFISGFMECVIEAALFTVLGMSAMVFGCTFYHSPIPEPLYYKVAYVNNGQEYLYWEEYIHVSNKPGICAEIYKLHSGNWGGEDHRKNAPWDPETQSHVGFAAFSSKTEAEAWGDSLCPNPYWVRMEVDKQK